MFQGLLIERARICTLQFAIRCYAVTSQARVRRGVDDPTVFARRAWPRLPTFSPAASSAGVLIISMCAGRVQGGGGACTAAVQISDCDTAMDSAVYADSVPGLDDA
eukprot:IDg18063t1